MPKIKFSHHYPKLWKQKTGLLIKMDILFADKLSLDLIEYDTKIKEKEYYPLPKKGKLIQLIFLGNKGIPFCTIRRHTPEKYKWYSKWMHHVFDIEVIEK